MYAGSLKTPSARRTASWPGRVEHVPSALRKLIGRRAFQWLRSGYTWTKHEVRARSGVPVARRLGLWRRGFYAESAAIYDLNNGRAGDYISDFAHESRLREVNTHNDLFAHKLVLRSFLTAMGFPQPETVALIHEGRILLEPFGGDPTFATPAALERILLEHGTACILKPEDGGSGREVALVTSREGRLVLQRGPRSEPLDLDRLVRDLASMHGPGRMCLLERAMAQAPFWAGLFPGSANTIRALTLWTPGEPAPFLARAVQRIGTQDTVPTDNWAGGGISAPIDLASGRLGIGRMHPTKGRRGAPPFTHHPDTGAAIAGAELPGWATIRATVLQAAASIPFNRMAGWDVLVREDGTPVLLEANGNSDVNLLQVHGGLLADPAVRRFYQRVGAV
jgi:hypothetical protein